MTCYHISICFSSGCYNNQRCFLKYDCTANVNNEIANNGAFFLHLKDKINKL